jgi:hypothetical protein
MMADRGAAAGTAPQALGAAGAGDGAAAGPAGLTEAVPFPATLTQGEPLLAAAAAPAPAAGPAGAAGAAEAAAAAAAA